MASGKSENRLFISRLSMMMHQKGLTQNALAILSSIGQGTINNYLNGKTEPRSGELCRLAASLNVSMDWLWGINDTQPKSNELNEEVIELRAQLNFAVGTLEGALGSLRQQIQKRQKVSQLIKTVDNQEENS